MGSQGNRIDLHQTLHGYSDGHRLLAASSDFSSEVSRTLLNLSDISGPGMVPGFKNYISGYPIAGSDLYVVGKTWYAPEMDRPGCVWTHSLLIEVRHFRHIEDLSPLLRLFRRPTGQEVPEKYNKIITLPVTMSPGFPSSSLKLPDGHICQILEALYGEPSKPVYVPAESSDSYENLFMMIWTQQWSRLRSSFSFCTGSLANRNIDGQSFDLQVVPLSRFGQLASQVRQGTFLIKHRDVSPKMKQWVFRAFEDLAEHSDDGLRGFLWEFGEDMQCGRAAFRPLVQTEAMVRDAQIQAKSVSDITESIAELFPRPDDGVHLKRALLGLDDSSLRLDWKDSELILALSTTKRYNAFRKTDLDISARAKIILEKDYEQLEQMVLQLLDIELNPIGVEFLGGVYQLLSAERASNLIKKNPRILESLFRLNPELATKPGIWRTLPNLRTQLFNAVVDSIESDDTLKRVIAAILTSGSDLLAGSVLQAFQERAVFWILEWFDGQKQAKGLTERWQEALSFLPSAMIGWLNQSPRPDVHTLALAASLLDPDSPIVVSGGSRAWLDLAARGANELDRRSWARSAAFLLSLGLNNPDAEAPQLVVSAFETIHEVLAKGELDHEVWLRIARHLPELPLWQHWDKCERLRQALLLSFVQHGWPHAFFFQAVKRKDILKKILASSLTNPQATKLLEELASHVADDAMGATEEQRDLLKEWRSEKSDEWL